MSSSEHFSWLHLTDLHYGLAGQRPLWPNIRQAFFDDLKVLHERCGPWQAVLFTGDLVQQGLKDEFAHMQTEVLARLWEELKALGSGEAVLLAVPGNHDLVRPDTKKPSAAVRQLLRQDGFPEVEEEFWADPDSEYRQVITSAFANYDAWWKGPSPYPKAPASEGLLPGDFASTLAIGSRSIGVMGLNTTFLQLAGGNYQGRLAWDLRQAQAVCDSDMADWIKDHDICLLLTHQGPDWLDSQSNAAYPEINPAGRFAVHLFGHMHEAVLRSTSYGGGKPLLQWQGCSLFGLEKFGDPPQQDRRHGYGTGRITFGKDGAVIRFWPRRATKDANGWRFIPDYEKCVLGDGEGTEPQPVVIARKRTSLGRVGQRAQAVPLTNTANNFLLVAYTKAARALWDIIDLAGLPEDDRHLAMQRFVLRQLYVPLRMVIDRVAKEDTLASLDERREQMRLAAAGRAEAEARESPQRESLGSWLHSILSLVSKRSRSKKKQIKPVPTQTPRLVILGDPGGGKTTLLRWLATAYMLRHEGNTDFERLPDADSLPSADWLPILIRCRELDKARVGQCTLEDLLRQTLTKMELPSGQMGAFVDLLRDLLEAGRAMLLIDGLDEITDPGLRAAFCERLEAVAKSFPKAPIIATSRIVGYREMRRRLGQGFAHATLTELSPEEKDDFVRRWCEVTITDPARRESEAEKLRQGIHSSDRIERLTTNPMLLTTMALVQRKVGKLPTRRHKLYWEAVGVLLNWRSEVEDPMDPDEALPQLEYLAYAMCNKGVQRLRRDEVLTLLEGVRLDYPNIRPIHRQPPESFLSQLERRTGLFVEVGEIVHNGKPTAVFEFRHLTFQEYLAALAILEGRFPGHQPGVKLADRIRPLAGRIAEARGRFREREMLVTENWREALRLCVASCNDDDVDPVLEAILEPSRPEEARPRAILATLCLADEPNVTQARANAILHRFAMQVKEGDGETIPLTGVDRAAMEIASSVWAELLCTTLTEEFLYDSERRIPLGGLIVSIGSTTIPSSKAELTEWIDQQIAALTSTSELKATRTALAIVAAAFNNRPLPAPTITDRLTALMDRGAAAATAASWALMWLSLTRHKPNAGPEKFRSFLPYMSRPDSDPQALQFLLTVVVNREIQEALPTVLALLRHPNANVRKAAFRSLGILKKEKCSWVFIYEVIDPQSPVTLEQVHEIHRYSDIPENIIREWFEKHAKKYEMQLEWSPN